MVAAFIKLNSGANWQKMQQKKICISASEKNESTLKSGVSNIGAGAKHRILAGLRQSPLSSALAVSSYPQIFISCVRN